MKIPHDPESMRPYLAPPRGRRAQARTVPWFVASLIGLFPGCRQTQEHADPSMFAYHGIIEGFYGTPWSHRDRLDILAFMGRVGLEDYVYAPKNDPYHRTRWRAPYPPEARRDLRALVDTARANGVRFWYAISPGQGITYSSSEDYQALLAKIDAVADLGVRHFGLFVDDVPFVLEHEADREAFGDLGTAHVTITNHLARDLATRGYTLSLTPTTYTNAWGNRDYLRTVGAGVDSAVPILWTGPDVSSPTITATQAREWSEIIHRKPLVWDNYPVNDFASWRLFLGPVRFRDRGLPTAALGLVANPMNQAHSSMIALSTLADYVSHPADYDPDRSLQRALVTLYGTEAATLLRPFVRYFGDYAWDSNVFEPLYFLRDEIDLAPIKTAMADLDSALRALHRLAPDAHPAVHDLIPELEPIVRKTRERIRELEGHGNYRVRGNTLTYRTDLDRFESTRLTVPRTNGGDLEDWTDIPFYPLSGPSESSAPTVAFAHDEATMYIGLRVPEDPTQILPGLRVGEGDHVALIIDWDPSDRRYDPRDILMLFAPPDPIAAGGPTARSMGFEGFMAKWLADNEDLIFTEFHLTTFGRDPAPENAALARGVTYRGRRMAQGYEIEIAIPRFRPFLRVSLTVAHRQDGRRTVWSLAHRNFPANPMTYAEWHLGN